MSCDLNEKGEMVIGNTTIPVEGSDAQRMSGEYVPAGDFAGQPMIEDEHGNKFVLMVGETPGKTEMLRRRLSGDKVQEVIDQLQNEQLRHSGKLGKLSVEKPIPKKSLHRTTQDYLAFGRGGLAKMIQHQQHAQGLMLKPYSDTILKKRLASAAHKTSEQMAAEKAAAPIVVRPKKRRRGK